MEKYLELGASKKRNSNWDVVNTHHKNNTSDVIIQDLTELPIKAASDNHYDGVYSEHFIEHFYKYQGINIFKEALRVLKPGGILKTVWPSYDMIELLVSEKDYSNTPFVQYYYNMYCQREKFLAPGHELKRIQEQVALGLLYQKGEHLYLWGVQELINTLESLGFKSPKEVLYGASSVKAFINIESADSIRKLHSSVVEAYKP